VSARVRAWARRVAALVVLVAIATGIGYGVVRASQDASAAAEAGDRFFAALRKGDVAGAYSQLSARRRATMSREAFTALTDHPAFRRHDAALMRPPKQKSPGLCSHGHLEVDGASWAVEVFYLEDAPRQWRVHSFAILPPAPVQLGVMLPECGYWEGTLGGYSGPPIERTTPALPL
jgi:hypothetical protein